MSEVASVRDPRQIRRNLITSVVWKTLLVGASVAFVLLFAPRRSWSAFVGVGFMLLFYVGREAWALATKRYAAEGPMPFGGRRLLWTNAVWTVVLVLQAAFVLWSPIYEPYVSSYSREDYDRVMSDLGRAHDESSRLWALPKAAKTTVFFGSLDDARRYAAELVAAGERRTGKWIDGNAIHDGHAVLGLVALREGRVADAKAELLLAGGTTGSPTLDTFGPNMLLAKELLERHEDSTVLAYFELCGRFWGHHDTLDSWSADVRAGRMPDFGANLVF